MIRQQISYTGCSVVPDPTGNGPTGAYLARILKRHRSTGCFIAKGDPANADILDGTSNTIASGDREHVFSPNVGWAGVIPGGSKPCSLLTSPGNVCSGRLTRPPRDHDGAVHVRSGAQFTAGSPGGFCGTALRGAHFFVGGWLTRGIPLEVDIRGLFRALSGRKRSSDHR